MPRGQLKTTISRASEKLAEFGGNTERGDRFSETPTLPFQQLTIEQNEWCIKHRKYWKCDAHCRGNDEHYERWRANNYNDISNILTMINSDKDLNLSYTVTFDELCTFLYRNGGKL